MNIILVIIDTLRYDYIGAHGNDWIQTPNMDRLAAESWVFTNSYTSSFPTIPHRTDVITGQYGNPFHIWRPLPFHTPTLPRALARAGYATQLIHDTPHLVNGGHAFDYPFHAWTFVRGAEVDRPWISDTLELPENWARDPLFDEQPESPPEYPGRGYPPLDPYVLANRKRRKPEDWNCAQLFRTASDFLRENAKRHKFFVWVDSFDPHEPWDAPPEFVLKYDDTPGYDGRIDPRSFSFRKAEGLSEAATKRIKACYAAKVSWTDHWLGSLLDTLEETGLKKNTALILTSDHGTNDGRTRGFGKSAQPLEGEAHTPFMVYAPGAGSGRSDIIVQPQDVFATVQSLVGGKRPSDMDSHDVLSIAREGRSAPRDIAIAGTPPGDRSIQFTAFDGEWCIEVATKPENCRLYRMGAIEDCADKNTEVVERLRDEALAEFERRGADPAIVDWIRREGEGRFPGVAVPHRYAPKPLGYEAYFQRLYHGEFEVR